MKARKVPLGTFLSGAMAATALGVPLVAIALYVLGRATGVGSGAPLDRILVLAVIFAGFPAFLSGGGVARLTAHRFAERVEAARPVALWRALTTAAAGMALVGAALAILTAVPLGGVPEHATAWGWVALAGLAAGVPTGVAIGVLVGMRQRRHVAQQRAAVDATRATEAT